MIKPKCDRCGEELEAYGALVFSPPDEFRDGSAGKIVYKLHICARCWLDLDAWIKTPPVEPEAEAEAEAAAEVAGQVMSAILNRTT
jgi:hypothetical protein